MIVTLPEALTRARRNGAALPGFSCYDAETAAGVLRAAAGRPVVLLIPARLLELPGGDLVAAALCAMSERAGSPVCVQLDHAHDLEAVRTGIDCGVGAVMADGSHLPPAANLEFVRAVYALAAPHGVAVEAAVGALAGDEDVAQEAEPGPLADPDEAAALTRDVAVDCLSVAIGNVHGLYQSRPALNLPRLRELAAAVEVPLVLHGGSGLSPNATRAAVAAGVAKVNYNTEIRQAYLRRTGEQLPDARVGSRLLDLHREQTRAVAAVAGQKLAILAADRRCRPPVSAAEAGR
ncbi:MAG TPA: class II fructose-bisphosphate aldolase [Solirubrobacteraceae bacterium]|nr:class II fructose-bisphosphate aldolase [Solirubrobacteraceae bacterium]